MRSGETDEGEESGSGRDKEKACRSTRVEVVRKRNGEDRRRRRSENDGRVRRKTESE